jgi:GTP-binding protein EngB required for normal cell division
MTVSEPPAGWLASPLMAGATLAKPGVSGQDQADGTATGVLPVLGSGDGRHAGAASARDKPPWDPSEWGAGEPGTGGRHAADGPPAVITLADRLTALSRLTAAGSERRGPAGFSPELIQDAEDLLTRAGERLRLSGDHTVVVLAGGTGSGKSSLFNRLAGAEFSPSGVTRPMTRYQHACVWGEQRADTLLDWLGVPLRYRYGRASALDDGERSLSGLVLLDLPDHDSVMTGGMRQVGKFIQLADLIVWVLDPQKYADAAVHNRYLVPMAGHSSVFAVVLNQADLLSEQEAKDCVEDLRRLLDTEGLPEVRVLPTSAVTGAGLDELRQVLAETVASRRVTAERISADVAALAARFERYAAAGSPEVPADGLSGALARSAGVTGVGRALQSARELRAVDYVGWPVSYVTDRLTGQDPLRKLRLGNLWEELRGVTTGPAGAQQAEVDNAITSLTDEVGAELPEPWPASVRAAARSRAGDIPAALGAAIADALPAENQVTPWWRVVAGWQGVLLGCAVTAVAWMVLVLFIGVFHPLDHAPGLFTDVGLLPWVAVMTVAFLLLGWLTAIGSMTLVVRTADREREQTEAAMRESVRQVAQRMVLEPLERELAEYDRFREHLRIALSPASR